MKNFTEVLLFHKNQNIGVVTDAHIELMKDCEDDTDVAKFVEFVMQDNKDYDSYEYHMGRILRHYVYRLTHYDLQENSFHNCDSLCMLRSFMGNYFFDDSYYIVNRKTTDEDDAIIGEAHGSDNDETEQGPKKLLEVADFWSKLIVSCGGYDKFIMYKHRNEIKITY